MLHYQAQTRKLRLNQQAGVLVSRYTSPQRELLPPVVIADTTASSCAYLVTEIEVTPSMNRLPLALVKVKLPPFPAVKLQVPEYRVSPSDCTKHLAGLAEASAATENKEVMTIALMSFMINILYDKMSQRPFRSV